MTHTECLLMTDVRPLHKGGAFYFYFKTTKDNMYTIPSCHLNPSDIVVGLMLRHRSQKFLYYVTTWDWKEILVDQNGEIVFNYP